MSKDIAGHNRPIRDALHPRIYQAIIGLVVWLVLSILLLFSGWPDTELIWMAITAFFIVLTAIPVLLWLTWRKASPKPGPADSTSLREWAEGQFAIWDGKLKGTEAAIQLLLPIAAVAFGMTAFGIVEHWVLG